MSIATLTDADLQREVIEKLKYESSVNATDIGVSVKDRVIPLTGHVSSLVEKNAAEPIAPAHSLGER